jgi:HK97 family phage major capsid protein
MDFLNLDDLRSIEELLSYKKELLQRAEELEEEFRGLPLPDDQRAEFAELKQTVDEIDKRVEELRARLAFIKTQAADERHAEPEQKAERAFQTRTPGAPTSEGDVFDLSTVRASVSDPAAATRELHDRALRALELATFPDERIRKEDAQGHVERLMSRDQGEVSRMILTTGSPAYRRAFGKYVVGKSDAMTPEERRALSAATETRAFSLGTTGIPLVYTLDPTVIPISNSVVNPLRAISSVEQISGTNEWRGVTSAAITASRVAEATEATDNTPTLAQPAIVCSKVHAFVPFSVEAQQDWGGIEATLSRLFSDAKDDEEASSFANGNGTPPNPYGVLTGATGTTAASTGLTITAANLYALEAALAPRFRPRAQMVANRAMYNIIRALDTAGGAQLWLRIGDLIANDPASGNGVGNTGLRLLGYPVNELSTMSATVVNGTKIMLLGDFSMFKIIDRIGMTVELIPQVFGATSRYPTGQRGLYAYWRNGSKVIDPVGFRALTGTT